MQAYRPDEMSSTSRLFVNYLDLVLASKIRVESTCASRGFFATDDFLVQGRFLDLKS